VKVHCISINIGPLIVRYIADCYISDQWCVTDWNSLNIHWISESITDSNFECLTRFIVCCRDKANKNRTNENMRYRACLILIFVSLKTVRCLLTQTWNIFLKQPYQLFPWPCKSVCRTLSELHWMTFSCRVYLLMSLKNVFKQLILYSFELEMEL